MIINLLIVLEAFVFSSKRWQKCARFIRRLCNTQAGENLNIYRNTFIGPMTKEAIRVQSYNKVMHKKIVIAHNNFEHCSQKIYLNHVQDVILVGNGDAKVVKTS